MEYFNKVVVLVRSSFVESTAHDTNGLALAATSTTTTYQHQRLDGIQKKLAGSGLHQRGGWLAWFFSVSTRRRCKSTSMPFFCIKA
jgi:hypothetical protein